MASKFLNKLFRWSKQTSGIFGGKIKVAWRLLQDAQQLGNLEEEQQQLGNLEEEQRIIQKKLERLLIQEEQY